MRSPAVAAWLRLVRIFQKVDHVSVEHFRQWDLNPAQFDVLAHVGAAEGRTQQELADGLLVTKGNVCQLLDRLEGTGLIVRRQDGRANRLYLTDAGKKLVAEAIPAHEGLIAQQFSALSPEEQVQLLELLRKVDRALG
jgi:DNA-binding MarR family transcriptional regulator